MNMNNGKKCACTKCHDEGKTCTTGKCDCGKTCPACEGNACKTKQGHK